MFLAVVGAIAGGLTGYYGGLQPEAVVYICAGIALLALAAVLFGLAAYGLVHIGIWSLGIICGGAMVGAVLTTLWKGPDGTLYGIAAGTLIGVVASLMLRPNVG